MPVGQNEPKKVYDEGPILEGCAAAGLTILAFLGFQGYRLVLWLKTGEWGYTPLVEYCPAMIPSIEAMSWVGLQRVIFWILVRDISWVIFGIGAVITSYYWSVCWWRDRFSQRR